eukprot:GFUD01059443.1.p1 GENE.GFUD01059443.1~~GFUD01059443.1.p1  ORF type:complete len:111 (+),score=33.63 GFUD01059443.1:55-387(+)
MLDINNRLKTESFLRTVFKTFDISNDGKITDEEIGKVLNALGRPTDEKAKQIIVKKYAGKGDKVDWSSSDFLKEIAATNVTDVNLVEDFVFSAAFSTFDQAGFGNSYFKQ